MLSAANKDRGGPILIASFGMITFIFKHTKTVSDGYSNNLPYSEICSVVLAFFDRLYSINVHNVSQIHFHILQLN